MSGNITRRYPPELKARAVRTVAEIRGDHDSEWAAMSQVADLLGVGTPETVRKWCRRAEVDTGQRAGVTSEEAVEIKRLRGENVELRRANAILKAASRFGIDGATLLGVGRLYRCGVTPLRRASRGLRFSCPPEWQAAGRLQTSPFRGRESRRTPSSHREIPPLEPLAPADCRPGLERDLISRRALPGAGGTRDEPSQRPLGARGDHLPA
jgi:transposase